MSQDRPQKFLETPNIKFNLTVNRDEKLKWMFEGPTGAVASQFLRQVASFGEYSQLDLELIEPKEIAALSSEEQEILSERVTNGSLGLAFLAVQLGLTTYEELGIK